MPDTPRSPTDDDVFSVTTLLKYMGNDDKALAIVTKIVRDACAPRQMPLDQVRAAIDDGRLVEAGKIFHGLRGSVGSLGAKRLVAASLALEQALAARDTAGIPALLDTVHAEYNAVLAAGDAWLAQL
ncbi:Hpt domain-containing protein [Duganella sp. FT27W]|uniref:Hpt domain-containing protein n=1 Tax=Duganella sp. FT27W TaxID=2654636 RepID=UPI00128D0D1C|nr:Hpt domain-containing protein [Duganella sp. FT27W]MPQ56016.1 Hpt domain-containing protein [Duganella sp. FT27W]